MSYIDEKYLSLLSSRLRNFKRKGSVFNFSCPLCGDSSEDRRKARGYCFTKKDVMYYSCKICGVSTNLRGLLRQSDPDLYRQYRIEEFTGSDIIRDRAAEKVAEADFAQKASETRRPAKNPLSGLLRVSGLSPDHMASELVARRHIPPDRVYHCDDFRGWVVDVKPGTFEPSSYKEPRLVIPFFRAGQLVGFQGRSYDPDSKIKYLTINLDDDVPLLYGVDDIKHDQILICVEGPIDSMFINNCVASAGGSISASIKEAGLSADNTIVCYDNEPRSRHTVKKMRQAAKDGFAICLWPDKFGYKDPNDAVMDGYTTEQLTAMIIGSAKKGLAADLGITMWRKCDA